MKHKTDKRLQNLKIKYGKDRVERLRGFLELPNGISDSDTFRRVYERLARSYRSERVLV